MGSVTCKFEGNILPLFGESEFEWPNIIRLILYLMGLGWTFLGIAIISDIFMASIEKITSTKKRKLDKVTGRSIIVHVWNPTVANLTLMALGSSAPEILLSCIEIATNQMFVGDLGAGTIVGSAAFNLLIISAVCVCAIEDGQVRKIKEVAVYAITATTSVLAYMWLMFIIMVWTPNVCTISEGCLTLFFCPALVWVAYLADRGYFERFVPQTKIQSQSLPDDVTKEDIAQIEQQIREEHGKHLRDDQVIEIMMSKYFTQRSRAYYRHAAMQNVTGGKKVETMSLMSSAADFVVSKAISTHDVAEEDKDENSVTIGFKHARYAFLENCGHAKLYITRSGPLDVKVSVNYATRDGTAHAGSDYVEDKGTLTFEKDQTEICLQISITDDNAYEENEEFYVDLSDPQIIDAPGSSCSAIAKLGEIGKALPKTVTVVIIDDDEPGQLRFQEEDVTVIEDKGEEEAILVVERLNGASGTVSCKYRTEDMTAVAGADYVAKAGTLTFNQNEQTAEIKVMIKSVGRFMKEVGFNVVLHDPSLCQFDPKASNTGEDGTLICHVTIKGKQTQTRMSLLRRMESRIVSQQMRVKNKNWQKQFYDALFEISGGDDDDDDDDDDDKKGGDDGPSLFDWVAHIVSLPWKLLFAFVPPVDYCGGWACFSGALVMIAIVTAIVGDMANLVGCCMDIQPEITAITFVALGTSLPDTFASMTAAANDPSADASIGNITGSNSVNVFLGLGLSWTFAAFYWQCQEPNDEWLKRHQKGGVYYDVREDVQDAMGDGKNGVFVVPAGSLGFNLGVFSFNAFFAVQHLWARRRRWGGELGGPKWGIMGQYFSAGWLVFQWFIYIGACSIYATIKAKD